MLIRKQLRRCVIVSGCLLAAMIGGIASPCRADDAGGPSDEVLRQRGEEIYRQSCADCHGEKGQGVESEYATALVGDASIGELSSIVADTMPEDDPDSCVGEDALAVAAYVHHAFYSEEAQVRNRPPRIELSRLTGTQLRQSLADLYAHFTSVAAVTDNRGVEGTYYDGARRKKENQRIERIDPVLDFDFGRESPGEDIKAEAFSIQWRGGLKVDVTGTYEIIVNSTCSFVMDFGGDDRELINNHVQSGMKTEFRRKLVLTAGRVYPFEIDFVQRERKTEQPPARISLSWVPPHGQEEIIPSRNLIPGSTPPAFSLESILPPDDRSYGYERGIAVNRQWDESTTAAALEFAKIAHTELWPRYEREHRNDDDENRALLRGFLADILKVAFRGSLDDDTLRRYVDVQVDATEDDREAIRRVLLLGLKSPRFLYPRLDPDASPSQRIANRLALTLYDSLPSDQWLLERIDKGTLTAEDEVREAAGRMVNDYRAHGKVRSMLYAWLNLEHLDDLSKSQEHYPDFDEELISDLRKSLNAMLDEIVWSESSDYRQLLQADWTFTTDRLAAFYGESWQPAESEGPALRRSVTDPEHRAGILTHPLLMSGLAYYDATSPIHRGVFLIRYVLGRTLRPPNEAFTPLSPDLHPDLTTRERVSLQTSPESCQVCHSKINALGFSLENFDAVGRFRTEEKEKPIDVTGSYITRNGETVEFSGAKELADYLVTSEDARRAFVNRAFQYFVKQPPAAYGPDTLDRLAQHFEESGYNIRELVVEIAVTAAIQPIVGEA